MSVSGFYRGKAVDCLRLADAADDAARREAYAHMARSWTEIAERAEWLANDKAEAQDGRPPSPI
jgi:hypothetical protein